MMIIALCLFGGAIALRDSYAARPSVQSSPFEMVEIDKIVSGKRVWGDKRVNGICLMGRYLRPASLTPVRARDKIVSQKRGWVSRASTQHTIS